MKKLFLLAVLLIPCTANAQNIPPCFPFGCGGATAAGGSLTGSIGAMTGAVFAAWVFPYLNTTGEKPFEEMFTKVDYAYPHDPKFWVNPTPESQRYPYKDETGVHYPKQMKNGI